MERSCCPTAAGRATWWGHDHDLLRVHRVETNIAVDHKLRRIREMRVVCPPWPRAEALQPDCRA